MRCRSKRVSVVQVPGLAIKSSTPSAGTPEAAGCDLSPQEKAKSWTPLELLQVETAFRNCGKRYVQDRR